MTIDKNQIGESRSDRFKYAARYGGQFLITANVFDCGMATVDHRCRTGVKADPVPKTFPPSPDVLHHHFIDIPATRTGQTHDVSRSVVPLMRNWSQAPVVQAGTDGRSSYPQGVDLQVLHELGVMKSGFTY
jgi:hypothetical protein